MGILSVNGSFVKLEWIALSDTAFGQALWQLLSLWMDGDTIPRAGWLTAICPRRLHLNDQATALMPNRSPSLNQRSGDRSRSTRPTNYGSLAPAIMCGCLPANGP